MSKRYDISREKKTKLLRRTAIIDSYNRESVAVRHGMSKEQFRERLMCDLQTAKKQREAARKTGKITCHKNRRHTPVACYKNGEIVKRFDSIHDAFRFLGSTVSGAINMCCDGKKKTYKGYTWRRV